MSIIIGAETEYGILGHTEKRGYITRSHALAGEVVSKIASIYPVFKRTLEGIKNEEEHEQMELALRKHLEDLLSENIPGALAQRHGISGMVPLNGARFYIDSDHPEYSIPETSNPKDAVIAQKAGDFIVNECRKKAEENLRDQDRRCLFERFKDPTIKIRIDRTNSDQKGSSYGGHENYSVSPEIFSRIVGRGLIFGKRMFYRGGDLSMPFMTFFSARQVITRACKV